MTFADFMQWIAVVRRHPLSALCGVIFLLCGATCFYIYGNMKWLDLEHKQLNQDTELALASLISGPSVRQELAASREVTHRIEDNLVVEDNLAENYWYFYRLEPQTKVHIAEMHPMNSLISDSRAFYRRIPFAMRVTGTYEQVGAFLYAIETGPRLSNITTLTIRRVEPDSVNVILDMDVELLGKK
jgi:Tfp pilus assembly protein PilO